MTRTLKGRTSGSESRAGFRGLYGQLSGLSRLSSLSLLRFFHHFWTSSGRETRPRGRKITTRMRIRPMMMNLSNVSPKLSSPSETMVRMTVPNHRPGEGPEPAEDGVDHRQEGDVDPEDIGGHVPEMVDLEGPRDPREERARGKPEEPVPDGVHARGACLGLVLPDGGKSKPDPRVHEGTDREDREGRDAEDGVGPR